MNGDLNGRVHVTEMEVYTEWKWKRNRESVIWYGDKYLSCVRAPCKFDALLKAAMHLPDIYARGTQYDTRHTNVRFIYEHVIVAFRKRNHVLYLHNAGAAREQPAGAQHAGGVGQAGGLPARLPGSGRRGIDVQGHC